MLLSISLIFLFTKFTESGRILAIMPTPSYSHQIVFNPLWINLLSRGHHITLLTTDPLPVNSTNLQQIDWGFAYTLWHEKHNVSNIIKNFQTNLVKCLNQYMEMMTDIVRQELQQSQVQQILENEQFDLVIVELLHPAMMAFSQHFHCPFIGISPMDITNFVHESVGNAISPALYPDFIAPFDSHMSFFERVTNLFYYIGTKVYFKYYFYPKSDEIVREVFGEGVPKLEDLQKEASMIFLNTNPIIHDVRPFMGNILTIGGGTQIEKNTTLPPDIRQFLDAANDTGAIYFSLGTNVKGVNLPEDAKKAFIEAFSELPYKVLWKFEDTTILDNNSKFMVKSWLPQQQILKHHNLKLFITQGGLQSLEEAIYNAIPIVAIPVYVDQFSNVRRVVRKGLGLQLEKMEKDVLKRTIAEVITNSKFKEKAIELSHLLQEQPISGLEQAIWWVEYILKHKGAKFLKYSPIPLYQYLLLDVIAVLLLTTCIILFLQYKFVKMIIRSIRTRHKKKNFKLE